MECELLKTLVLQVPFFDFTEQEGWVTHLPSIYDSEVVWWEQHMAECRCRDERHIDTV